MLWGDAIGISTPTNSKPNQPDVSECTKPQFEQPRGALRSTA